MPLSHSQSADPLADAMRELTELWATVGHDNVDDQPVKVPTKEERKKLGELMEKASKHLKARK
jgi:hypothetical protein